MIKKRIYFGLVLSILLINFANAAFGVNSACDNRDCYWEGRPLALKPGEAKELYFGLQTDEEDGVTLRINLTSGSEIATLIDENLEYKVMPGINTKIGVGIKIPKDNTEKEHNISILAKQISSKEGGMVQMSVSVANSFPVVVFRESTEKGKTFALVLGMIIILMTIYLVLRRRKKLTGSFIFLFCLVILILGTGLANAQDDNAELSPFGVSVTIGGPPTLTITSPIAGTYFNNESLKLEAIHNAENLWYNIDNSNNISFNGLTFFDTTEGSHTIYVFANNTRGTTEKNVTFAVDLSLYNIIYDEFKGSQKGASTDFDSFSFEQIQNLSGVILENTNFGKINFNHPINITDDGSFADRTTDIDSSVEISFNNIALNSTQLPNFNLNSTLTLYSLTFSSPRILKDGAVCPQTICSLNYYAGGDLSFNVTEFGIYSAEETSFGDAPSGSSGGGRTSGKDITASEIIVVPSSFDLIVIKNIPEERELAIANNGNNEISLNLEIEQIGDIVSLDKELVKIPAGGEGRIKLAILSKNEGVHAGKILIKHGSDILKEILIVVNVRSGKLLFDAKIFIPEKYRKLFQGDKIISKIELIQLGEKKRADVTAKYTIKDFLGNTYLEETETFFVLREKNFSREFNSDTLPAGNYVLGLEVVYPGGSAVSSAQFEVIEKEQIFDKRLILLGVVLVVIIGIIILILKQRAFVFAQSPCFSSWVSKHKSRVLKNPSTPRASARGFLTQRKKKSGKKKKR